MRKIDLSIVDQEFLKNYSNTIDIAQIRAKLKKMRPQSKFKSLIINLENIIKSDIRNIEKNYLYLLKYCSNKEKKKIENIFNYSLYRSKKSFMEYFKKLNIKSCPFCNNNYVYFYKKENGEYNTIATLEHYYPKSTFPHLSLSFFNLIPSCNTCNSKFKGSDKIHVGNILHPYYEDFNENAKFSVRVESLPIENDINLEINLKSSDIRCNTSIDRFQLDKIYKEHNDIAKEIWNKAQFYNKSKIKELYDIFYKDLGYSKEDIKDMVFCNYLHKDNINKRNHSKLTQDILLQFDIINNKKRDKFKT